MINLIFGLFFTSHYLSLFPSLSLYVYNSNYETSQLCLADFTFIEGQDSWNGREIYYCFHGKDKSKGQIILIFWKRHKMLSSFLIRQDKAQAGSYWQHWQ